MQEGIHRICQDHQLEQNLHAPASNIRELASNFTRNNLIFNWLSEKGDIQTDRQTDRQTDFQDCCYLKSDQFTPLRIYALKLHGGQKDQIEFISPMQIWEEWDITMALGPLEIPAVLHGMLHYVSPDTRLCRASDESPEPEIIICNKKKNTCEKTPCLNTLDRLTFEAEITSIVKVWDHLHKHKLNDFQLNIQILQTAIIKCVQAHEMSKKRV